MGIVVLQNSLELVITLLPLKRLCSYPHTWHYIEILTFM